MGPMGIFSDIMNVTDRVGSPTLWYFHNKLRRLVGDISPMGDKELGERNFGFDSLKSRLNRTWRRKGLLSYVGYAA